MSFQFYLRGTGLYTSSGNAANSHTLTRFSISITDHKEYLYLSAKHQLDWQTGIVTYTNVQVVFTLHHDKFHDTNESSFSY